MRASETVHSPPCLVGCSTTTRRTTGKGLKMKSSLQFRPLFALAFGTTLALGMTATAGAQDNGLERNQQQEDTESESRERGEGRRQNVETRQAEPSAPEVVSQAADPADSIPTRAAAQEDWGQRRETGPETGQPQQPRPYDDDVASTRLAPAVELEMRRDAREQAMQAQDWRNRDQDNTRQSSRRNSQLQQQPEMDRDTRSRPDPLTQSQPGDMTSAAPARQDEVRGYPPVPGEDRRSENWRSDDSRWDGQREQQQRLSREQQERSIREERQRADRYYRDQHRQHRQLADWRARELQQHRRLSQYRYQQQYHDRLRRQQAQWLSVSYNYYNDPFYYTPSSYRYSYGGRWYETNRYGADLMQQAINYGYQEGMRAGRADREDRWRNDYGNSYAYQDGSYGYQGRYLGRDQYAYYFRQGFERGYQDGYRGQYRYGQRRSDGTYAVVATVLSVILGLQLLR